MSLIKAARKSGLFQWKGILIITLSTAFFTGCDLFRLEFWTGKSPGNPEPSKEYTPPLQLPDLGTSGDDNGIGMNIWFLSYWDGSNSFVDAMKHSSNWQLIEGGNLAPVDEWGWPASDAKVVVQSGIEPWTWNSSGYHLVFEGQGDASFDHNYGKAYDMVYDPSKNETSFTVDIHVPADLPEGSDIALYLSLRNTRRTPGSILGSGVKNVRLYRPGYGKNPDKVFIDPIVNALKASKTIRAMDWVTAVNNTLVTWSERTTPFHSSQSRDVNTRKLSVTYPEPREFTEWNTNYGVALEHIVQLCNAAGADLWINVPFQADDGYVTKMFQLIRYGSNGIEPYTLPQNSPLYPALDPGLKVYVEYSNENWNTLGNFHGNPYIKNEVANLPAGHPVLKDFFDDDGDNDRNDDLDLRARGNDGNYNAYFQNVTIFRYNAWRTMEIADMARSVFGDSEMMVRVRPLLCTQQGNANGTLSLALTWADHYLGLEKPGRTLKDYFYGGGGSAYYDVDYNSKNHDEFFAPSNYPDPVFVRNNQIDSAWLSNYGLKRVAYEGGISLDAIYTGTFNPDLSMTKAVKALNADPRMKDVILATHKAWAQTGGDLLSYYCLYGGVFWEFINDPSDTDTPKMQALLELRDAGKSAVSMGQTLPGTMDPFKHFRDTSLPEARDRPARPGENIANFWGYKADIETPDGIEPVYAGFKQDSFLALPGNSSADFTGTLTVRGQRWLEGTSRVAVWINGEKQGTVELPHSAGLTDSTPLTVNIPRGLVVVRIELEEGALALNSVTVK